jgi:acetyl/propionyl-CoA carboxylase alpha subunit
MTMFQRVLIANRGEIAVRIAQALHELDVASVAVYADDDAQAMHVQMADAAIALGDSGPAAYLNAQRLIDIAHAQRCDAIHPGYGFLSENAAFAQACQTNGLCFIGPTPEQLALLGDKAQARALAKQCGIALLPGTDLPVTLEQAQDFWAEQYAQGAAGIMLKAVGGGGGRGMRAVYAQDEVAAAYARCRSEAMAAFGVDGLYVERLMDQARHIELQVLADGQDVLVLGERECTVQRRFQKLVEIAPSPNLSAELRSRMAADAVRMAASMQYQGLATFEFLVDSRNPTLPYVFMEANARLQVEHTITEAVFGVDLVQAQIRLAAGQRLVEIGLDPQIARQPLGFAIQWRINAETLSADGSAKPGYGAVAQLRWPQGPGLRVDTHIQQSSQPSPHYDTLLAKLVVHHPSSKFADVLRRSQRALMQTQIQGIATNLSLLRALGHNEAIASQKIHTRWLEQTLAQLLARATEYADAPVTNTAPLTQPETPLAVEEGAFIAPMPGRVVQWYVAVGDVVSVGTELGVLEAMKMEHVLHAAQTGRVVALEVAAGCFVQQGQSLLVIQAQDGGQVDAVHVAPSHDLNQIRPDLQRVVDRHRHTLDAARTEAMAKRHAQGSRSARENISALCDAGSFLEYGALAIAAQTRRRTMEDLISNTPADGMVTGIGSINADQFGAERARAVVMAYDATVLAGTQGARNHAKTDRMLGIARAQKLPVVLFAEGGGGRPGDTDIPVVAGLHVHTFAAYAALSGEVPVVGIAHGRCFAGNAALLGCSDVIIATRTSTIGMGGPAMIEGGGLGVFKPEQVGPSAIQHSNGVIDILVEDEDAAVHAARHYLSFFQGSNTDWIAPDSRLLRHVIPENRLRVYDTRQVMHGLVDEGSLLMLRAGFGAGIHTALARIEGRPVGLIVNNPGHLGGAIDADAADKAARFMQLCNAHGIALISLVDTPGFMVGPEIEKTAQVRHVSRLFVTAAKLSVPFFSVVLRKGYGLGAMGMTAGSFHAPVFNVAWPTGEFGAMGLEGAVRLGFRKELEAQAEGPQRDALFQQLLAQQYAHGEAMHMAATLEIDAVIDPADTRHWLVRGLQGSRVSEHSGRWVDTW